MPYPINPVLNEADFERHHSKERHYIERLREKGLAIELDNIVVDAEQLVLRTFQCDTTYCVTCAGSGDDLQYKGSCCTDLQVDLAPGDKAQLRSMARMAQDRLDLAPESPLREIVDLLLSGQAFETNADQEELFVHRPSGRCVMSVMDGGRLKCSINMLASDLKLTLHEYKPSPCYLFPLHYGQFSPDGFILSVLCTETRSWIEQHACVGKLKCLRRPQPGSPPAYVFLRGEIEYVLGKDFYRELDRRAQPLLERFFQESALNGARS